MSKAKLKKQVNRLIADRDLDEFGSDGQTWMHLVFPSGAEMEISIIEDEDGYNFLAVGISHPMDN